MDGLLLTWSQDPIALSLGPLTVRWYGLFFLSGFYMGFYFMQKVCQWEKKPVANLDPLLVYLIAGTTIGARLGHCFFYEWDYYSQHLTEIPMIWRGGLASHGGTIGVILALFLFSRRYPDFSFPWLLDRIAVPSMLAAGMIRLGNFMNSEIVGKPTGGNWGVIFTRVDQIPRHPTQIYESLTYITVWMTTVAWYFASKKKPPFGLLFGWSIGTVFLARIFIERLKENQEAFEADMSLNMGQLLSIPFVIVAYILFARAFIAWRKAR